MLETLLGTEWYEVLKDEFDKSYMKNLQTFLKERRREVLVLPDSKEVFNAYKCTPISKCRVCIIGQDPYSRDYQAVGLSFSTKNESYTPSLIQIEEAVRSDMDYKEDYKWSNNLTRWTEQGVMLLNSILTVDAGSSLSHAAKGWEIFTLRTVQELDKKGIIFMLWGKSAQEFIPYIKNSIILKAEHPVASSYQKRKWIHNSCFKEANKLLDDKIKW